MTQPHSADDVRDTAGPPAPRTDLQRALGRLAGLRAVDAAIIRGTPFAEIASGALRHVRSLIQAGRAAVIVYDHLAGTGTLAAVDEDRPSQAGTGTVFGLGDIVPAELLAVPETRVYTDLAGELADLAAARLMVSLGYRSACWSPMVADGLLVGMLVATSPDPAVFAGDAGEVMAEVAAQLAVAIRAGLDREAARRAARRLELLHGIDRAILDSESTAALARRTAGLVRSLIAADRVVIARYEPARGIGYRLASARPEEQPPEETLVAVPLSRLISAALVEHPTTMVMRDLSVAAEAAPGVRFMLEQGLTAGVFVPLVAHGALQGGLIAGWRDGALLIDEHVAIAGEVADQLAVAILHADAHERLERSAARLELIHEIDRAILSSSDTATIAARAVGQLRHLAGAERVSVVRYDLERRIARVLAFDQERPGHDVPPGTEFALDQVAPPALLEDRELVILPDLAAAIDALPGTRVAVEHGMRAAAMVPLAADGHLVGAITLTGRDAEVLTEDNLSVAREVADQLVVAILEADARTRLELANARLELMHEIDGAILGAASPTRIAEAVIERLGRLLQADLIGIAEYGDGRRSMLAVAGIDAERIYRDIARDMAAGVGTPSMPATLEPMTFADLNDAIGILPTARISLEHGLTAGGIVPIAVDGRMMGMIGYAARTPACIEPERVAVASEVASQLAIAISGARARLEIERSARRLALIHEVDLAILASESTVDLAARVAGPLARLAGARRLDISVYDLERDEGRIVAFAHDGTSRATPVGTVYPLSAVVPMVSLEAPELMAFDDMRRHAGDIPLVRAALEAGLVHGLWIPLIGDGRLLGAIGMAGDDPTMMAPEVIDLARAMGDQLAVALQHAEDREQLAERERRLSAILGASPNGILAVDASGTIQYANPAAHRLFRAADGALAGLRHATLIPPAAAAAHPRLVEGWFEDANPTTTHPLATEAVRIDGTTFPVHVLLARVETATGPLAIATVVDLSERTALEARLRQAERLETLGQFAGILAHDVRNYLTAVAWSAELLESEMPDDDPRMAELGMIRKATEDAIDMTRTVLEFARPTGDPRGVVDVAAHLAGTRSILVHILGSGIQLELQADRDLPLAGINATALTQVLGNLASNARDAMPDGGSLRITAQLHEAHGTGADAGVPEPGRYVRLVVADTGVGMDEDTRRRAFEAFYTTKTMASTARGTGLGLSSVFLIVTKAGGSVRVDSVPGLGTTFTVDLPAAGAA